MNGYTEANNLFDLGTWWYEGIAFYAFPKGSEPPGASPVYRLWSNSLWRHYYTASEAEKDTLMNKPGDAWIYEGIAWYAIMGP